MSRITGMGIRMKYIVLLFIFLFGIILFLASLFASQYITHCCMKEWYALPAMISIWVIRIISVLMVMLPFAVMKEESKHGRGPSSNE